MTTRFRTLSTLTALALALAFAGSSARAEDASAGQDSLRAMQRAELLIRQKQFKSAAAEFERASDLSGGSCPECLLGTARAYSGAGQQDAAIQVTRMALTLSNSPDTQARAYQQLGSLLTLKGDMDGARKAFQKALEMDGSLESQVRSSMAEALLKRASSAEAAGPSAEGVASLATAAGPQLR